MRSAFVARSWWLAAAAAMAGCTQWHPESVSPSDVVATNHPARLRVTARDSSVTIVDAPLVAGDSLRGRVGGSAWAIALSDVSEVAVRRIHGGHSALLIGGLAAVTAGIAALSEGNEGTTSLRGSASVR